MEPMGIVSIVVPVFVLLLFLSLESYRVAPEKELPWRRKVGPVCFVQVSGSGVGPPDFKFRNLRRVSWLLRGRRWDGSNIEASIPTKIIHKGSFLKSTLKEPKSRF